MATQAKVIITGQNDIGSAVRSTSKDLSSLKDSASKLGNALKTTFSVTAILATVKKLGDGVVACFSDSSSAERSYKQLALAIGNTESFSPLVTCIDGLSRQTLSSKDDIESMVSELAALGKSADEIEKIASASVYLSKLFGIGGKLASLDLHIDHAGADKLKKNADRSFESIGPILKNAITDAVSTASTVIDNILFTGYLSTNYSWTITASGEQAISVMLEDVGTRLLGKAFIASGNHLFNCSATDAISAICAAAGITVSQDCIQIPSVITKTVDSSKTCKDILEQLVYELGYAYYFDNLGQLRLFKIDCTTTDGIPTLDGTSLCVSGGKAITLSKKIRSYRSARIAHACLNGCSTNQPSPRWRTL